MAGSAPVSPGVSFFAISMARDAGGRAGASKASSAGDGASGFESVFTAARQGTASATNSGTDSGTDSASGAVAGSTNGASRNWRKAGRRDRSKGGADQADQADSPDQAEGSANPPAAGSDDGTETKAQGDTAPGDKAAADETEKPAKAAGKNEAAGAGGDAAGATAVAVSGAAANAVASLESQGAGEAHDTKGPGAAGQVVSLPVSRSADAGEMGKAGTEKGEAVPEAAASPEVAGGMGTILKKAVASVRGQGASAKGAGEELPKEAADKLGQKGSDKRGATKLVVGVQGGAAGNDSASGAAGPGNQAIQMGVASAVAVAEEAASASLSVPEHVQPDAGGGAKPASAGLPLVSVDGAANKAGGAESAAGAQEPPPVDPQQTFDQVVLGLRGKMDARNGTAEIQLNPPNLGTLNVSIQLQNGALTAEFKSGSEVVRDLLKGNLEKLKSVLESQGIAVDKLSVQATAGRAAPAPVAAGQAVGPTNPDGRNGGQQGQEQRSGRQAAQEDESFARLWQDLQAQAPLDLVA
jgi:flagellar hook-length control protein FliK